MQPAWEKCEIPKASRRSLSETSVVRRLMNEWHEKREDRRRKLIDGEITQEGGSRLLLMAVYL